MGGDMLHPETARMPEEIKSPCSNCFNPKEGTPLGAIASRPPFTHGLVKLGNLF